MVPGAQSMDIGALLALAAVLGWASGLRLYAVLFMTGLAGSLVLMVLLLVTLFRFLQATIRRVGSWFGPTPAH